MFRRFGVIKDDKADEVLINLDHIVSIERQGNETRICLSDETNFVSSIDYSHLASAMDGYIPGAATFTGDSKI